MLLLCLLVTVPAQVHATPITVVITTVVKKVIRAMDLAIQRLQNETVKLQGIQKAIENAMAKLKLQEIAEWGKKQKELFEGFYDELWKIKSAISSYKKVKAVVDDQIRVVKEYRSAIELLTKDKHFSPEEIEYMLSVYTGILQESIKNVDQIHMVVNAFATQMSDGARLELLNKVSADITRNLTNLRRFTGQNIALSLNRSKDELELNFLKALYGVQ